MAIHNVQGFLILNSRLRPKLSLAESLKPSGLSLKDFAQLVGVSYSSARDLASYPPSKRETWVNWSERMVQAMPHIGRDFLTVLESDVFRYFPKDLRSEVQRIYVERYASVSEGNKGKYRSGNIENSNHILQKASQAAEEGKWVLAESLYSQARSQYLPRENGWAECGGNIAQIMVNYGDLYSAEHMTQFTEELHSHALTLVQQEWYPSTQALLQAVRAWSMFLRGIRLSAIKAFARAEQLAYISGDTNLINRGLHMRTRALVEDHIIAEYFPDALPYLRRKAYLEEKHPFAALAEHGIDNLDTSMRYDVKGSLREGFGLWYKATILLATADRSAGYQLLSRASSQIREASMNPYSMLSHSGLTKLHFDILENLHDVNALKRRAEEANNMSLQLVGERYPYALADALITTVYCRCRAGLTKYDLEQTTDLLALALMIHPYPENMLWRIGEFIMTEIVLPDFMSEVNVAKYVLKLQDRIRHHEPPFDFVNDWFCDIGPLLELFRCFDKGHRGRRS